MQAFGLNKKQARFSDSLKDEGGIMHTSNDPKLNEESITPYVIINKTDIPLIVKRLFEREKKEEA